MNDQLNRLSSRNFFTEQQHRLNLLSECANHIKRLQKTVEELKKFNNLSRKFLDASAAREEQKSPISIAGDNISQ